MIHWKIMLPLIALLSSLAFIVTVRAYYYRGFMKARRNPPIPKDKNPNVECDRFRRMILKLFELQIIQLDEHIILEHDTVQLNIRDIYPLYKTHYPMYFPDDVVPEYLELLDIIQQDKGYSGFAIAFFEKAAYRHSISLKRFIEEIHAASIR